MPRQPATAPFPCSSPADGDGGGKLSAAGKLKASRAGAACSGAEPLESLWFCHGSVQKRMAFGAFLAPHHARPARPSLRATADRGAARLPGAGRGGEATGERDDRRHPRVCVCVFDKGTRATGTHRHTTDTHCLSCGGKDLVPKAGNFTVVTGDGERRRRRHYTGAQAERRDGETDREILVTNLVQ